MKRVIGKSLAAIIFLVLVYCLIACPFTGIESWQAVVAIASGNPLGIVTWGIILGWLWDSKEE